MHNSDTTTSYQGLCIVAVESSMYIIIPQDSTAEY